MKNKLNLKIPKILFLSFAAFLFLLWLNSFVGFVGDFGGLTNQLKPDCQKVLASEKNFHLVLDSTLYNDTLIVPNDSGYPGEAVWISVNLHNSIPLVGWQFKLVYNTESGSHINILTPDTMFNPDEIVPCDTNPSLPCTTWYCESEKGTRVTYVGESNWFVWTNAIWYKHLDTLRSTALINFYSHPDLPYIQPGLGEIVRFKFLVNPQATPGSYTDIKFGLYWSYEQSQTYPANTLSDTSGLFLVCMTKTGRFTVRGGTPSTNHCPVFTASAPADSYEVNEGQKLQFAVTATDQDTDNIELSLSSISPSPPSGNYHFTTTSGTGSVTQTFDYTPGYDEASPGLPTVRTAVFKAEDDQGCTTTKTVKIVVQNTVQDLIVAGDKEGGVAGSGGVLVPFVLTNSTDVYGFQFTFRWDASKLDVDSIVRTGAIEDFTMYTNLGDSAGKATVLVFGLAGETIPSGVDTMVYAAFSVHEDAPSVEVPITLENAREAINPGDPSKTLGMVNGKFTIDMFGDVNSDRLVDVGDVVSLVAYILSEITYTPRQMAASDINQDTYVNVGDLVAMIDIILGRWMGPSPQIYTGIMATVRLDYQDLAPGSSGEVKVLADTKVPVAGAQLQIDYDPVVLTLKAPRLSDRSGHFIVESHDDGKGKLKVVLYNFSNDPISAGEGTILSIPASVSPNAPEDLKIELKKVVLSDQKAVLLPTEGESPSLPSAFELDQNYPNPFNPSTTIRFTIPSAQGGSVNVRATLRVYNILGEAVKTLVDEPLAPGTYEKVWDGKDGQGNSVASGIYFYKLKAGDFSDTKKMVMMK
jgi:hypothetical protein